MTIKTREGSGSNAPQPFPAGRDPFVVEIPPANPFPASSASKPGQSIEDGRATFSISVTTHAHTQKALFFYHLHRSPPQTPSTPTPAPP